MIVKSKRAKCEECVHCKLINDSGWVTCEYLKSIEQHKIHEKPMYCPNFKKLKELKENV